MKISTLAIAAAIGAMSASGAVYAGGPKNNKGSDDTIDDDLSRRPAGSTSGSGHTVEGNCGGPEIYLRQMEKDKGVKANRRAIRRTIRALQP